ncbi:MAG: ATP-binding cassette domain-containing protein [Bacteroidales bacterium]|nr:ATP-binding cassette domain-containing protein [Bacteroidales bacterium]
MISLNNLSVHFTGTDLFSNVSLQINEKDKVGLVGKNGSGKTTLLRIIAGEIEPQIGDAIIPGNLTLGYLRQTMEISSTKTIVAEASTAFDVINQIEEGIQRMTAEISERGDFESESYNKLIVKLSDANEQFFILGGHTRDADIEKVLTGLGFRPTDLNRPVKEFSHGWQMRVELAKILLGNPQIILLDEPTNHLDIESIQWLEEYLISFIVIVIRVSHGRMFLDSVTTRTLEIENSKVYDYKAGYSDYLGMREERVTGQLASYNNQQRQIRQIERFIERFRYKNTKASQVQSRVKMLEKLDEIEIDERDTTGIHFNFPPAPRSGKVVLETSGLTKKYDDFEVLRSVEFAVIKGQKVAFIGKNGEGKTTLSRIIVKELEYTGELKYGHNTVIGYHAQDQEGRLDPDKTVFETLDDIAVGDIRKRLKSILGAFLFSGEDIDKKVKVLSGGEKSRLSLARLLLKPVNLLVLDEPTNHLDMLSKDVLKSALLKYDGTLILVSHDRDFLQGLTTRVYEFRNKGIKEHLGDISNFLEKKKLQHLKELERKTPANSQNNVGKSGKKIEWEKKKKLERQIRKVSKRIQDCENKIENIESAIREKDLILSDPQKNKDLISSGEIYKDYDKLKKDLESEMNGWEEMQLHLEELRKG